MPERWVSERSYVVKTGLQETTAATAVPKLKAKFTLHCITQSCGCLLIAVQVLENIQILPNLHIQDKPRHRNEDELFSIVLICSAEERLHMDVQKLTELYSPKMSLVLKLLSSSEQKISHFFFFLTQILCIFFVFRSV